MKWLMTMISVCLLAGCCTDCYLSGYTEDKIHDVTIGRDLERDGSYGKVRIYVPDEKYATEKIPFIVYFRGSESEDGLGPLIEYIDKEENPAIVMVVPYGTNDNERAMLALGVEDYLTNRLKAGRTAIDPRRIYVTGFGKGGYEAWKFALENTELISTVAPVCGGPDAGKGYRDPDVPVAMTDINVWAIQYVDDPVINNDYAKKIVTAIWTQNLGLARITEFLEGGHTPEIYKNRVFLDWIFGTVKAKE